MFTFVKMHALFRILSCVSGVVSQQLGLCVFRCVASAAHFLFLGGNKMKRSMLVAMICCLVMLSGCCSHEWIEADCVNPRMCSKCGETAGAALGHNAPELTCTKSAFCIRCNDLVSAPGHSIVMATCDEGEKCAVCDEVFGEALGHTWKDATCVNPITCEKCGETQGEALGHAWIDADCVIPRICSVCNATDGEALGHDAPGLSCTTGGFCNRCHNDIDAMGHSMSQATCTEPATCKICGITEGEALGHTTANGLCERCNKEHYEDGAKPMKYSYSHFTSMPYEKAVAELEDAGFSNIELKPLYDLGTGWFDSFSIDKVDEVSIDGNNRFEAGGVYAEDVKIIIEYHSLEIYDPNIQYTTITASELVAEIEKNAMRAKETYEDTYIIITGRVENIDSNGNDFYLYPVDDSWALIGIECNTLTDEQKEFLKTLSTGDVVTVRGKLTYVSEYGCDLDIYLTE